MATGAGELREYTPLLVTGRDGSNTVLKEGELAPGLEGVVCEHVFADATSRQEATVVVTSVPETVAYMPALVCRDRATLGAKPAQLPAERWMPVELESVEFNRRYRLLTLAGQDPGWVRELFSPALIAWLADRAPAGLSFELNEGHLVVAQPAPPGGAGAIDGLVSAAAELRTRLRAEALEEEAEPDLFDEAAEVAAVVATLDEVRWREPPASVGEAVERYARAARWKPKVLINAVFWATIAFAVPLVLGTLLVHVILGIAGALFFAPGAFVLTVFISSHRYRWGNVSVQRVALEAWARGYADSRHLELVDRWRWHSDRRSLPLPGFADHVLYGEIPGTSVEGWFAMLGDAAELRSTGKEMAMSSDRPLASSALVVRLEREPTEEEIASIELPDTYSIEHRGNEIAIWRPVHGNLLRTSEGSDRFREKAGALLAPMLKA